jgi:hypothetical protein
MKARLITLSLLLVGFSSFAQIKAPAPSPAAMVKQTVGLTEVTVEYSRPGIKGREVFGNLVPYGEMWRTGANKNSMITFEHDVAVAGTEVEAGTYAIFTTPDKGKWAFYLYTDSENWGTPENWDQDKVAVEASVPVTPSAEKVETMRFSFENVTNTSADLVLAWDLTKIMIPIETKSKEMTLANIKAAMGGPGYNDYYQAAKFYRTEGMDMKQAVEWSTKATELAGPDRYWIWREHSLCLAAAGDKKGAIEAANKSIAAAEKAGNMDYVRMNKESIAEWGGKVMKK